MHWNDHSRDVPKGSHAPFSASKCFWLNYDIDKALAFYKGLLAVKKGTKLHEVAKDCIDNGILLKGRNTMAKYVNDAISYRMRTEQPLVYSNLFYGTSDAIIFRNNLLRIHDLKTGVTPAKMDQLLVYDALYCLEYGVKPVDIDHELRIYQNDEVIVSNPAADEVEGVMNKITEIDRAIDDYCGGQYV